MLVVGLTGGIGSGKTTVANMFAALGTPIIDADLVAREVTQPGSPALDTINAHFEQNVLKPDGSLDRAALRRIIFDHPSERIWLEALLHPIIRSEIERQTKQFSSPYCIVVIPLLFESKGNYPFIQRVIVVDAPEAAQIARVTTRDSATAEHVSAIMDAQMDRAARLSHADDVINNEGSIASVEAQVLKLHKFYLGLSQNET